MGATFRIGDDDSHNIDDHLENHKDKDRPLLDDGIGARDPEDKGAKRETSGHWR